MVKRTITITTIALILSMIVSVIIVLNRFSFAADSDIASGTSGTCSWVIDSEGVLTIRPTNGVSGILYSSNTSSNFNDVPWHNYRTLVKKVIVGRGVKAATGSHYLFFNFSNCTEMDLSNLDTSALTNMMFMFYNCSNLTSIDLSKFDTRNVTNMNSMFYGCEKLAVLNLSSFNTSRVTNMHWLFNCCKSLTEIIGLSSLDTSNVTIMDGMFSSCEKLSFIEVSHFDTSKVTDMNGMFAYSGITSLDVSNWDTSNVTNMSYMFQRCNQLTSLDLRSFDTSKVNSMVSMFNAMEKLESLDISNFSTGKVPGIGYGPENRYSGGFYMFYQSYALKTIKVGANFKFKKDSYLTTPSGNEYSGKWIREDKVYGPYTPEELYNNYNSSMKGTWIWENAKYTVSYAYSGTFPKSASELPEEKLYEIREEVTVAENATAIGYTFSGWSRTGTFKMPVEDVVITGSFTPNTDTPYIVEHYLEDLNADTYTLKKTDYLTGTTDTEVEATAKEYEGFTFDSSIDGTKINGTIAADGSLVLKLYYKRNSYNISYSYTGDVPDNASELPQSETYKYEEEIIVPEAPTADGYTFSGWIKDYINMPSKDVEITGYFIEVPKSYNYKIEYFFDGEIDESLEEILNAEKGEEISITPQTPLKRGEKNYTLVSNNHNIVISINDEDNVIRVYYETDVLDYAIDNFEDTTEGDGIPDKYQISITYKVENGNWNDGTKGTKTDIITLKDKDGNLSEEGTGATTIPEVGNNPSEGYEVGTWNEDLPKEVFNKDNGKEFIYSYKKSDKQNNEQKEKTDITEASGKIYNPKTDDIMYNYLLAGIGGILVLSLVSKIRKKYSRKAKKVQF